VHHEYSKTGRKSCALTHRKGLKIIDAEKKDSKRLIRDSLNHTSAMTYVYTEGGGNAKTCRMVSRALGDRVCRASASAGLRFRSL
jgi:hypothetical protein